MGDLEAQVRAVNLANDTANKLYPALVKAFAPLVGQKIEKADRTILAKYQALLPEFPCTPKLHVYRSSYELGWTVKACVVTADGHSHYHEATVCVGEMAGQVLVKILPYDNRKTDYTVEQVELARKKVAAARHELDEARSALYPFGER